MNDLIFTEARRYEYQLTPNSVVIDVGGHKGSFARQIAERYGSKVYCFEPVVEFFRQAVTNTAHLKSVSMLNFGVGAKSRREIFWIKGDMTGMFADGEITEEVEILSLIEAMNLVNATAASLLKINSEGSEWELMEFIVVEGIAGWFENIQVQYHPIVGDYDRRYAAISEALSKTHELTYHAPWCWENWRLKKV